MGGGGRLGAFELAVVLWKSCFRSETVPGARVSARVQGIGKHRLELRCYFFFMLAKTVSAMKARRKPCNRLLKALVTTIRPSVICCGRFVMAMEDSLLCRAPNLT